LPIALARTAATFSRSAARIEQPVHGRPDNNSLYSFVIDRLTERSEVADVRTSVVYEHIRSPRVEPA